MYMDENVQETSSISIVGLVRLLLKKVYILLLVVIIGGVFGGALAAWKSKDVDYYGTTIEFFINPRTPTTGEDDDPYKVSGAYGENVLNAVVRLLSSQDFAETLMAGMEGAPQKNADGSYQAGYKAYVSRIQKAVDFYYKTAADEKTTAAKYYSFFFVKINVLRDEAFATNLLQRINEEVPKYVETKIYLEEKDNLETNCLNITPLNSIVLLNPGYMRSQIIKYAFLFAFASGVVACVVVILLDRADKRLRDTDVIQKRFNIPLLGIIPLIGDATLANKTVEERETEDKQ